MNTCYRTLCYGTSIKNILRGSFLHKDNLDLILAKNYSLEYMRIQGASCIDEKDNTILDSVFEQQAFGSILDAKVLSCTFKDEEQQHHSLTTNQSHALDENQLSYTQRTRQGHSWIRGNDIIALISEYGQLVFCTVVGQQPNLTRTGRFECVAEITLDEPGLEYTKVNKKLAIDPWSRAIAIASYQDRIDIMILNDSMSRGHFSPVNGMGSIEEKGIIWHMDFLQTETGSWDRILLAVIVYNDIDRVCRIIVYSIDASNPNKALIKLVGRLPLERKTPLPVLLFPLPFYHESFVIVTEHSVCVLSADDISCGNVLYPVIWNPDTIFDANRKEDILINSYSLAANPTLTYVYLGTAEGYLLKLDMSNLDDMKWIPCQQLHPMGQDMCMLGLVEIDDEGTGDPLMAEALLYIGESADSQVIGITRDFDECDTPKTFVLQTLINRAPLTDWQVVRKDGQPDTIVCCSGQGEQGALHYLSRDIDSTTLYTSATDWNGVTKLWCFRNSVDRTHLVASSSYKTRLVFVDKEDRMDDDTTARVETDTPTIYADSLMLDGFGSVFIQVTPEKIILSGVDGGLLLEHTTSKGFSLLLGSSWTANDLIYISICISDGQEHILQVLTVSSMKSQSALTIIQQHQAPLASSPSCLYHFTMMEEPGQDIAIVAIGTYASQVVLYSFDSQLELVLYQVIDCQNIPHSLATIGALDLLCLLVGTRLGELLSFGITAIQDREPSAIFGHQQVRSLGNRPVTFTSNQTSCGLGPVFAACECVWNIDYDQDARMTIEAIHIQGVTTVEALVLLAPSYDQEQMGYHKLAIVANQRLHAIQVQGKGQVMTRKQVLSSTPRKLLLHDHSTSYLVTSTNHRGKTYYQLQLINKSGHLLCEHRFDYGETVMCLSNLQVHNKSKMYHYVCVGIEHQVSTHGHGNREGAYQEVRGSLHMYRLKALKVAGQSVPTQYSIRPAWKIDDLRGGVQSICPHSSGLLFSSGNTLHLHQFDIERGILKNITHKTLRFPITSIHVAGDRICVTGHTESVSFYAYDEETMQLSFLTSDSLSRNVHHSLLLSNRVVVGVSHSGGMFALKEPDQGVNHNDDSLQTLFCFHYPDIIIKPRCISLRSHYSTEYTSGILSDHLLPWTHIGDNNNLSNPDEQQRQDSLDSNQQQKQQFEVQPIVGCTISGGVIMAFRCSETLFATLDSLQHRLVRYVSTQPLLGSTTRYLQWYNDLSGPQMSTIHLDLIAMYLRLTTEQQEEVVRLTDGDGRSGSGHRDNSDMESENDGMDSIDNSKDSVADPSSLTLVDLTLALVSDDKQKHYRYRSRPDWTQQPARKNGDDLVIWTAMTLNVLITKLEQYYC